MRKAAPHLLILFVILLAIRSYSYHEPFSYDIPVFSVMANELLDGKRLYVDVWDHKPPAIYILFAMAQLLAGYGPGSVFLLNAMGSLAILTGVFMAASRWGRNPWPGIWASAFWVVISGDVGLQANQPKAELFMNAGFIWILALMFRLPDNETRSLYLIGGLTAFVSLFKPHAVLLPFLLVLGYLLIIQKHSLNTKQIFTRLCMVGTPVILVWALIVLYFLATDRGLPFYEAIITYNRSYAGSVINNIFRGLSVSGLWPSTMNFTFPLILAGLVSWILHTGYEKDRLLIIIYGISVVILIASPGRFFSYYYQLWLPILALFGAELVFLLETKFPKNVLAMNSAGVMVVLLLASFQARYFEWTPYQWAHYKDDGFLNYPKTAKTIDRILEKNETFFVWGPGPALYFYTQRRPPMRFVNHMPISGGPLQLKFIDQMVSDLALSKPALVVMNPSFEIPKGHAGLSSFFEDYRPLTGFEDHTAFKLFALKSGELDKRTKSSLVKPEK